MENQKKAFYIWIAGVVVIILLFTAFTFIRDDGEEGVVAEEQGTEETIENETPATQPTPTTPTKTKTNNTTTIPQPDALAVSYTSEGFSPFVIEVNAGDTVNFVNDSQGTMWVTSEAHPTADQHYPEFGMSKSIGPGEVYEFQFTLLGAWGYKNLNNEKHLGAVVVIPQKR